MTQSDAHLHKRIAELIGRYRVAPVGGRFRVRDCETGMLVEGADYDDEALAGARCKMEAARQIIVELRSGA